MVQTSPPPPCRPLRITHSFKGSFSAGATPAPTANVQWRRRRRRRPRGHVGRWRRRRRRRRAMGRGIAATRRLVAARGRARARASARSVPLLEAVGGASSRTEGTRQCQPLQSQVAALYRRVARVSCATCRTLSTPCSRRLTAAQGSTTVWARRATSVDRPIVRRPACPHRHPARGWADAMYPLPTGAVVVAAATTTEAREAWSWDVRVRTRRRH